MTAGVLGFFYDILTCVHQLAPIASQGSALPSDFGGSERLRKKEFMFFI